MEPKPGSYWHWRRLSEVGQLVYTEQCTLQLGELDRLWTETKQSIIN